MAFRLGGNSPTHLWINPLRLFNPCLFKMPLNRTSQLALLQSQSHNPACFNFMGGVIHKHSLLSLTFPQQPGCVGLEDSSRVCLCVHIRLDVPRSFTDLRLWYASAHPPLGVTTCHIHRWSHKLASREHFLTPIHSVACKMGCVASTDNALALGHFITHNSFLAFPRCISFFSFFLSFFLLVLHFHSSHDFCLRFPHSHRSRILR